MPDFSPKYCPECGYKTEKYSIENKICLNCGFKMDGLVIPPFFDMETLIGFIIITVVVIILLIASLLLFEFCIICELAELINKK